MAKKEYTQLKVNVAITPENKCTFCTGSICCTYITELLETPRSIVDFDHLLWQISHENVQIYKDEDGWYLLINNKCHHLMPTGGCSIYEQRPQTCRDHHTDECEKNIGDFAKVIFKKPEDVDKYRAKKKK